MVYLRTAKKNTRIKNGNLNSRKESQRSDIKILFAGSAEIAMAVMISVDPEVSSDGKKKIAETNDLDERTNHWPILHQKLH
jgi:hypothetical protein